MSHAEPIAVQPDRPKRRRRHRLIALGALVVLFAGLVEAHRAFGRHRLARAIAEADRLDPGWRTDQLEARRAAVAGDRNGALRLLEAARLAEGTANSAVILDRLRIQSYVDMTEADVSELGTMLQEESAALEAARRLADTPEGRYPIATRTAPGRQLPVRDGAVVMIWRLLTADAAIRAHDGDAEGALRAVHAMLNLARSIGDEPTEFAQWLRMAWGIGAARFVEHVLARGEPSDEALARLQDAFRAELETPRLLTALRALRAESFDRSEQLRVGELDPERFGAVYVRTLAADPGGPPGWAYNWMKDGWYRDNQATLIETLDRLVEAAKAPDLERRRVFAAVNDARDRLAPYHLASQRFLLTFHPSSKASGLATLDDRRRIYEGCAVVLLAAGRYRRARGHLPESLDALVPAYLKALPRAPYGNGRFRSARRDGALVVYGVDARGSDMNGDVLRPGRYHGNEGLRLLDVRDRRRPTAPSSP
ncbi:MAG TPA: hypothetical protein VG406_25720 [Isosphaeraceae bacterium]|jgi:hypothetical protein|nr:hypothetical protein [Isosphaeraceae bacterium]